MEITIDGITIIGEGCISGDWTFLYIDGSLAFELWHKMEGWCYKWNDFDEEFFIDEYMFVGENPVKDIAEWIMATYPGNG